MMYGDLRDDWRIRAVEQKADRSESRLYELDTLRNNVDSLERANVAICACIDGLRGALDACLNRIEVLEREVAEIKEGKP